MRIARKLFAIWVSLPFGPLAAAIAGEALEFNRDIRPLLSDNCYACHGPDAGQRQAGLRLDQQAAALAALESGAKAIVPGDVQASELLRRVRLPPDDPERMPPADSGKTLSAAQVALLAKWIEQGANWQGHWAFLPVSRPDFPVSPAEPLPPIDRFVRSRLAQQGVSPAPTAAPNVLARRLAFDLTGLPPTPEQVARLAAAGETAYPELVDELLASPRFGERMAMWWLDLVRYADSVGYHGDQAVSVYPFREYVIRSFNDNKRFDAFTRQQLAGDLLPGATVEDKIASGYNRLGMMSAEGGVQPKEYLCKYIAERVRNVSGAWLGVTIGCAECHDHKFDPFATRDFYRLEAFFADIQERGLYAGANVDGHWGPSIQLPSEQQKAELARIDGEIAAVNKTLATPTPELEAAQVAWEAAVAPPIAWSVLRPVAAQSAGGATLTVQEDGALLASGPQPETDTYTLTFENLPAGITGLKLETIPHDTLPGKGAGRAANGNFMLTELHARYRALADGADEPAALQNATETFAQKGEGNARLTAAGAIDGDESPLSGWATVEEVTLANHAVFETRDDLSGGEGRRLTLVLVQNRGLGGHTLGHFRISATSNPRPVKALGAGLPRNVRDALALPPHERKKKQRDALAKYFRTIAPQLEPERQKLAELQKSRAQLNQQIPTTLVTAAVTPRTIRVLPRGNWMDESGEVVEPGVPEFLPPALPTDRRLTRLDLANWLTARENPLTARVFVNRVWELFFGAGLSRKLDDLGAQGEWPAHPALLDWLAVEFMDSGWDVKHLVRQIVLSETYRQSSDRPDLQERDPYNFLLARQARFRFDAETVRDNALAVSGLLVERLGGPSVRPYQPRGYWAYLNFPVREWENSSGDDLYRRGLYTHWQRQYLHPSMLAFDAPSREECTADRPKSNTPLQALVLLNDVTYVEAARALAERIIRTGGTATDARLEYAFELALSRPIRAREAALLGELLGRHREQYRQDPAAAGELLKVGARPLPADIDPAELAAWTSVARAILNLHEMVTRS
ncbi:MAG: PSD1 domain-containing protein [Planctomycetaceae bacterium]|nr:PSD1 domain-containing protein [Planctomycetaceae bacterium]